MKVSETAEGSKKPTLFFMGYGSQAQAWTANAVDQGFEVVVWVRNLAKINLPPDNPILLVDDKRFCEALNTHTTTTGQIPTVCILIPDVHIATAYETVLGHYPTPLNIVLGHGFAIDAGLLKPSPLHTPYLFAVKSIGPEIRKQYVNKNMALIKAAILVGTQDASPVNECCRALGIPSQNLIECTFEQETKGDLFSEQLLLCGGLFKLIQHTLHGMRQLGVPEALIQQEVFSELLLLAQILNERGLEKTFDVISENAKIGAIKAMELLEEHNVPTAAAILAREINDGTFYKQIRKTL